MKTFFNQLLFAVNKSLEYSKPNIVLIGVMGTLGFPSFYIIWKYLIVQPYENLTIRLLGSCLFFPLIFHNKWPKFALKFLAIYWGVAVFFATCIFFPFMLFKNEMNDIWKLSAMTGAVLLVFVSYDLRMIVSFYLSGISLTLLILFFSDNSIVSKHIIIYLQQSPVYGFIFIFGAVFNQTKERLLQEKHKAVLAVGSTIAHEIRTPLSSIRIATEGFRKHLPNLINAYEFSIKYSDSNVRRINPIQYKHLKHAPSLVIRDINHANTTIDMLLFNANNNYINSETFDLHSITTCVASSLESYPFKHSLEKEKITYSIHNFKFHGNDAYLKNVFFNLLNNAFYFIAKAKKGEIMITSSQDNSNNYLHFKDTSMGIKTNHLKNIFMPFFSSGKNGGTGIGLSLCKDVMTAFKGDISCESIYGQYTIFTLSFPKIPS